MEKLTATAASQDFLNLIKSVTEEHKTYQIEDSSGSAVILSKEDYEGLLETLELLAVPGFRDGIQRSLQQIADGETFSLDEVLGDI